MGGKASSYFKLQESIELVEFRDCEFRNSENKDAVEFTTASLFK